MEICDVLDSDWAVVWGLVQQIVARQRHLLLAARHQ